MVLIIDKKRSIGEAAIELGLPEHVIRFWETQFGEYIKPTRGNGKRRYFYDKDIKILNVIREYLYEKGYTIAGLKKLMEQETIFAVTQEKKQVTSNGIDNNANNIIASDNNSTNSNKSHFVYVEKVDENLANDIKSFKKKLSDFYEKLKNI